MQRAASALLAQLSSIGILCTSVGAPPLPFRGVLRFPSLAILRAFPRILARCAHDRISVLSYTLPVFPFSVAVTVAGAVTVTGAVAVAVAVAGTFCTC